MKVKNMKKIIAFVLALVMVLGGVIVPLPKKVQAADGEVQITLKTDKTEYQRGDTVTVTVEKSGLETGIGGVQVMFKYNAINEQI